MKIARFFIKLFFYVLLLISILIFTIVIYLENYLTNEFKIKKGDALEFDTKVPVTAEFDGVRLSQNNTLLSVGKEYQVDLKAFGIIPFSTVNVEVVDEMYVSVLGKPFGMRIYTQGVLVIDLSEVETENGIINPATKAGLKKGDYILTVDGEKIDSNEALSRIVENSEGKKMDFLILRNNTKIHIYITAVISKETGDYKIGVWVRDSCAGIGTLTFYSPATDILCGLGHGVCDEDTSSLLSIEWGEIVNAQIFSVDKSTVGGSGQLNGGLGDTTLGEIDLNSEMGVYSKLTGEIDTSNMVEVALKQEIQDGDAKIICTLEGEEPQSYSCKIKIRTSAYHSSTQNMVITITDKRLLEITGGIVQGMSGSPIIQNGKLIGAVTHVIVDDPTKGYGIFAENMLETAQKVASEQLKAAS